MRKVLQHSMYDFNPSAKTNTHQMPATYPNQMAVTYPNQMALIPQFPIVYPTQYVEMPNPMFYSTTGATASMATPQFPEPELQTATADVNKVPLTARLSEEPIKVSPSSEVNDAALQLVSLSSTQNLQEQGTAK